MSVPAEFLLTNTRQILGADESLLFSTIHARELNIQHAVIIELINAGLDNGLLF